MIRRPPRSTLSSSSAASDVYKRQSMSSTITSTLSSSIEFIQLKLTDYGQEKMDFEKIIRERFQNVDTTRNVNQKLELLEDNHMDYLNPICPHCKSYKIIKQEYSERKLDIGEQEPITAVSYTHLRAHETR